MLVFLLCVSVLLNVILGILLWFNRGLLKETLEVNEYLMQERAFDLKKPVEDEEYIGRVF